MIMNQKGDVFLYYDTIYTVGSKVYANGLSEYEGLYGWITEIREGSDLETGHSTPDIYCRFMTPVMPDEIQTLEDRFSSVYGEKKYLDEIDLESVILSPQMLILLEPFDPKEEVDIYLVREDWAFDDDYGTSSQIAGTYALAKFIFQNLIYQEHTDGYIRRWRRRKDLDFTVRTDSYECWLHDEYFENHYKVTIEKVTMPLEPDFLAAVGRKYISRKLQNKLFADISQWEEIESLSDNHLKEAFSQTDIGVEIISQLRQSPAFQDLLEETIASIAGKTLKRYMEGIK